MYSHHGYSMWNGFVPSSFHVEWMYSILIPCGLDVFHPHSMWNGCIPSSFHVEWMYSILIPCGIYVESMPSFHVESMWTFHHSMWNLDIPSSFHMESTWNPCGMETPKWLGSQPKCIPYGMVESMWNPCGMRSIPCRLHVESTWNVGGE